MTNINDFYRAFEEKHRGPRDLIKSRLKAYRPFVAPLLKALSTKRAVDLGCGRGEWLELIQDIGFDAFGVDLDEGMLQSAQELGLPVEKREAVAFLKAQPEDSVAVLSGFHIVEHIPFSTLQELVQEAFRVLAPGGLLILETPNPENVTVGSNKFYLDPTHERPIPPELLSFVPEHYGFKYVKLLRLHEAPHIRSGENISLLDVLEGVSPDYAVIAQKPGPSDVPAINSEAFEGSFGANLATLALRHEKQVGASFTEVTNRVDACDQRLGLHVEKLMRAINQAHETANQAQEAANRAESAAHSAHLALEAIHSSHSWKITAPLRWISLQFGLLRTYGLLARVQAFIQKAIIPFLSILTTVVDRFPKIRQRIVALSIASGQQARLRKVYLRIKRAQPHAGTGDFIPSQKSLTPRAQQIYRDIKAASLEE